MASVSTRKAPNVMNFLRQIEVMTKSGEVGSFDEPQLKVIPHVFPIHG